MNKATSIDTQAAAPAADTRSRVAKPDHVPDELVRDIDMYALDGIEAGYHEAWVGLHAQNMPKLVWTPLTGGHWIAMDGPMVREIYEDRSEEHTSELQSLMRISYAVFCLKKKKNNTIQHTTTTETQEYTY